MAPDNHNVNDVTELVFFDGHTSNEEEANALATVRKLDGCLRVYNGSDLNDNESGIWVQDWKSLKHHAAFQQSEIYPSFVAGVPAFAKSVAKIVHVCFHPYPADPIFRSALTEMIFLFRKPDVTAQQVEDGLKDVERALGAWQDGVANARGLCLEDDQEHVIVCGWGSENDREEFRRKNDKVFEDLKKFGALKSKLFHLKY